MVGQKTHRMFPLLHQDVVDATAHKLFDPPAFQHRDQRHNVDKEYATNIMGHFQCPNSRCSQSGWASKVVAINIRLYRDDTYNAVVYNQRCRGCNALGSLSVNEQAYVERVSYRLLKWNGLVSSEKPAYGVRKGPPHEASLCEGCKCGKCRRGE